MTLAEHVFRTPAHPGYTRQQGVWQVLGGCLFMFLILQFGAATASSMIGQTPAYLLAASAMIVAAVALERIFFGRGPIEALSALGFRKSSQRATVVAVFVAVVILTFFPVFSLVTDATITLRSDWWWILLGAIALNGIAEEVLFRGYVFGGLRRLGFGFGGAATISLVIFAAVHLILLFQNPVPVALLATLVAISAAFPAAYLFERGNNSIWAPVILHVAAHAFRFVEIDQAHYMTALVAWLAFQICAPFLVLVLIARR
jgi:membrane protease YdiL (CAAX protease family)